MSSWKPDPQKWSAITQEQGGTIQHRISVIGYVDQAILANQNKANSEGEKVAAKGLSSLAMVKLYKKLRTKSKNCFKQTQTKPDGTFYFNDLPQGRYTIEVESLDKPLSASLTIGSKTQRILVITLPESETSS